MEDFEYSVEICDCDWESCFMVCEDRNLLPPSLAVVDDSGMSDFNDTGSLFANRVQKVDLTARFSGVGHSSDGSPDFEDSPVEDYLSKHGVSRMESVLSGSEEDIHLQSINIFFEQLENTTETERFTEPSQVRAGKIREAIQVEEHCCDGQQTSSIPKLHCLPARGETAVGKETSDPFGTISTAMKKDESGSNISTEPAASKSVLRTKKLSHPESKLVIIEEACTKTRLNEATQWRQSHDSPDRVETTPNNDKVINVERSTPLDDIKHEDQFTLNKIFSTDSWSNAEMMTNDKWRENQSVSNSDATSTTKTVTQGWSPSASVKRKRRKKRRLGAEPAESVHGCERQVLVKLRDSDEEQRSWRGGAGLCVSDDVNSFHSNEPLKNVMSSSTAHSATSHIPVKMSAKEMKVNDLSHRGPPCESIVRQGGCKATGSAEDNATKAPLSQTDDSVMSAINNCGDVETNLQPCSQLQVEESTVLNTHPEFPVSIADGVTGKSGMTTGTAKCGRKDIHGGSLQQSDKMSNTIVCCENEQLCTVKVKSLIRHILPSTDLNDPAVEVGQSVRLSAAKSVLAEEAGKSGNNTPCQRQAEPQQQLGIGCHYTDQYSPTLEETHFPLFADGMRSSGALNTKPMQFKTRAHPVGQVPTQVDSVKAALDSNLDLHITAVVPHTLSKLDVLPEINTTAERTEIPASQIKAFRNRNPSPAGETNLTGKSQREVKSSISEDLLPGPSDGTPVSSCCNVDTGTVMVLSSENITHMSGSSCMSVSHTDSGGQGQKALLAKHAGAQSPSVSNDTTDSNCDSVLQAEDATTASKAEYVSEMAPTPSVFAISSFWSEMEKVTIKDILELQMISKAAPPSYISPLQESEKTDVFSLMDSGSFNQPDESKPQQTNEDTSSDANSRSSSGSVSSRGVIWESEHIYTDNMTSVSDISPPVQSGSAQTCLRKIWKNVSVRNLHALESFNDTWKSRALPALTKGELENVDYFTSGHLPKQDKDMDCLASSVSGRYRISLTGIFHYLFGRKQSNPSQSATDDITTCYTDGNSVPETYDHFFSDFDAGSFFSPLITADQAKDELVCSCFHSANRNLQFPEAYDYFFASSSSDDSSEESDEEENSCPVRVVNSLNQRSNEISTDIYENFFTDNDLRQNFFWKNTFSFRKINFTGPVVQKHSLSNPAVTVRPSRRSLQRTVHPVNAFGDHIGMFSDPPLYNLEDRISRQLAQQPFTFENFETAANPCLDAPLLPLRQSDMCLVCIAFASWVLKTANPQVGDAWKAVLLANVSALSAIRYLRKYVKMEAAAGETKEITFQHPV